MVLAHITTLGGIAVKPATRRTARHLSGFAVSVGFLILVSGSLWAQSITYPTAIGVIWHRGEEQTITWTGIRGAFVEIDLYRGGRRVETLSHMAPNTGSYAWRIPGNQKVSTEYRIRVTGRSKPHDTGISASPFTIIPPHCNCHQSQRR